ncbi:hypothetical protein PPL_11965 [Heterostelium album PN500]|uniref:DUSP domain-containing protein n=1 Tax=Heterostelium pallidum (strain ATCC 26659 / Pp 5 / PN500) TaxID=670386 RepID=D3BUZ3_HETP5|nr:hypothetical protein PPL_11965 [Heterostelium album PN500]EFA74931.1 hypothetical protein PPL_11965 [Heterostelium album PN500]|eukprot:XP_020427065.1 hypothetical protein PPL_11965 [Heterostelium album PN500]
MRFIKIDDDDLDKIFIQIFSYTIVGSECCVVLCHLNTFIGKQSIYLSSCVNIYFKSKSIVMLGCLEIIKLKARLIANPHIFNRLILDMISYYGSNEPLSKDTNSLPQRDLPINFDPDQKDQSSSESSSDTSTPLPRLSIPSPLPNTVIFDPNLRSFSNSETVLLLDPEERKKKDQIKKKISTKPILHSKWFIIPRDWYEDWESNKKEGKVLRKIHNKHLLNPGSLHLKEDYYMDIVAVPEEVWKYFSEEFGSDTEIRRIVRDFNNIPQIDMENLTLSLNFYLASNPNKILNLCVSYDNTIWEIKERVCDEMYLSPYNCDFWGDHQGKPFSKLEDKKKVEKTLLTEDQMVRIVEKKIISTKIDLKH